MSAPDLGPANYPAEPEEWRPVVGYEKEYMVSSLGRVWSNWKKDYRIIHLGTNDYAQINLWSNNVGRNARLHRIVAEAFLGPCPPGMECCHNDGNHHNNAAKNLRWDTRRANIAEALYSGGTESDLHPVERPCAQCGRAYRPPLRHRGRSLVCSESCRAQRMSERGKRVAANFAWRGAKLRAEQVREIKRRLTAGEKGTALAREFHVSKSMISVIKQGKAWGWLSMDDETKKAKKQPTKADLVALITSTADAYAAEHDHVVVLDDVVAEAIAAKLWDRYLAGAA